MSDHEIYPRFALARLEEALAFGQQMPAKPRCFAVRQFENLNRAAHGGCQ
jgi:hypothetical protein